MSFIASSFVVSSSMSAEDRGKMSDTFLIKYQALSVFNRTRLISFTKGNRKTCTQRVFHIITQKTKHLDRFCCETSKYVINANAARVIIVWFTKTYKRPSVLKYRCLICRVKRSVGQKKCSTRRGGAKNDGNEYGNYLVQSAVEAWFG